MSFLDLLSSEQRANIEWLDARLKEQQEKHGQMDNAELVETAEYYLKQMAPPKWRPGEMVYDGIFHHVLIPEMLKRLSKEK